MERTACRVCGGLLRDGDDTTRDGDAHAPCVEAHADDRRVRESPLRRFFRRWGWGIRID